LPDVSDLSPLAKDMKIYQYTLGQGPGGFVSSQNVVELIVSSFDNSDASKFIGEFEDYVICQTRIL
jgi:hypothetical protein